MVGMLPQPPTWADAAAAVDKRVLAYMAAHPNWFTRSVIARLVETPTGCWEWTGSTGTGNARTGYYGQVGMSGQVAKVHRVTYLAAHGAIGYGLTIDHLCGNTLCANPDHLEAVDARTNVMRGETPGRINAAKTHCPRGHPLDAGNLRPSGVARGRRQCLECSRVRAREQSEMVKAAARHLGISVNAYKKQHGTTRAAAEAAMGQHLAA